MEDKEDILRGNKWRWTVTWILSLRSLRIHSYEKNLDVKKELKKPNGYPNLPSQNTAPTHVPLNTPCPT